MGKLSTKSRRIMGSGQSLPHFMLLNDSVQSKGETKLNRLKTFLRAYAPFCLILLVVLLAVEIGGMAWLNNWFLIDRTNYVVVKTQKVTPAESWHEANLDNSADEYALSTDGRYLASLSGGIIRIADFSNGTTDAVSNPDGMQVARFCWAAETDALSIAYKYTSGQSSYLILYAYQADDKTLAILPAWRDSADLQKNPQTASVSLSSIDDTVTSLDISSATQNTWFAVTPKSGQPWLGQLFMWMPERINLPNKSPGKMKTLQNTNEVLYEDQGSGNIYVYDGGTAHDSETPLSVNGRTDLRLLGVDGGDTVYLAPGKSGKVDSIFRGSIASGTWQTVSLGTQTDPTDITVSYSGQLYIDNRDNHQTSVLEWESGKSSATHNNIRYAGTIIGEWDSGFVCIDSGHTRHYAAN
jgi:hypothetical protein